MNELNEGWQNELTRDDLVEIYRDMMPESAKDEMHQILDLPKEECLKKLRDIFGLDRQTESVTLHENGNYMFHLKPVDKSDISDFVKELDLPKE